MKKKSPALKMLNFQRLPNCANSTDSFKFIFVFVWEKKQKKKKIFFFFFGRQSKQIFKYQCDITEAIDILFSLKSCFFSSKVLWFSKILFQRKYKSRLFFFPPLYEIFIYGQFFCKRYALLKTWNLKSGLVVLFIQSKALWAAMKRQCKINIYFLLAIHGLVI